mmetsp:Transcript_7393/g.9155  ORF Transcript_7393/g.9155 Transcript_7393/m.9155 type:complete len:106 (-) Transcript_7393:125-442(-)
MQCAAILCHCAAIFVPPLRKIAHEVQHLAHLVLLSVAGCMAAQINQQIQGGGGTGQGGAYAVAEAEPISGGSLDQEGYVAPSVVGEPPVEAVAVPTGEKMDRTFQ